MSYPKSSRVINDLSDIELIMALDWLSAPRAGLEHLESVESGRKWNACVRARDVPLAKSKKPEEKQPMIPSFDRNGCFRVKGRNKKDSGDQKEK